MTSNTWEVLKKIGLWGVGAVVVGAVLLGVALWPLIVGVAHAVVWVALTVWSLLPLIVAVETVVVINMRLDWLGGQWQVVRWRTAWLLAHWTMLVRGWQLAVWYAQTVTLYVTEARRVPKALPVAQLEPAPLFVVARNGETTREAA